ncbi:head GIN domain-containing protein [Algivirga pacifica]|uniref:Head GIN domain-containing protein n=1 Tax=Algivirga pacifica TaxID=1162670 RepID=A0ABP9DNU3_9BACT
MKTYILTLAFLSLLFTQNSFAQKTETRKVDTFEAIKVGGSFNVTLQEGKEESVTIEVKDEDLLEDIITEVKNGTLKIRKKNSNGWSWNSGSANITITYKNINKVSSSGSSDIVGKDVIKNEDISLSSSGSGDMDMKVDCKELSVSLSGSSDIELEGDADDFSISLSGSADVEALELQTKTCEIHISGSGDVDVSVSEALEAYVSGSGNVRYKGNPERQRFKSSGSGDIEKIN